MSLHVIMYCFGCICISLLSIYNWAIFCLFGSACVMCMHGMHVLMCACVDVYTYGGSRLKLLLHFSPLYYLRQGLSVESIASQ